jgi:2-oxo-4-hydroxy-4-carboxy-5-ureidoimidazoline decarboxylase
MDSSAWIDGAPAAEAAATLQACCASAAWVARMMARRPFGDLPRLLAAAREEWFALTPEQWKDAFAHHPRIGDRSALRKKFSGREQAGVREAGDGVIEALAAANQEYERRFGYIFIVCASGKSADEMLALLRERLGHDADEELAIAAEEHAKITELRLRTSHQSKS